MSSQEKNACVEVVFPEGDPVGTIRCDQNPLGECGSECRTFSKRLIQAGFTGNWEHFIPPEGDFVDMREIVGQDIIDAMIENGIYPYQKM